MMSHFTWWQELGAVGEGLGLVGVVDNSLALVTLMKMEYIKYLREIQ